MSTADSTPTASPHRDAAATAQTPAGSSPTGLRTPVLVVFVVANLCCWMAFLTPMAVTLALRIRELSPQGASSSLSLVIGLGAIVGIIANPLCGRLSDRTRSRFGMRRPWIIGGVALALVGLYAISQAPTVGTVTVGWVVTMIGAQAALAAVQAILPDHIPPRQRGRVGGFLGVGQAAATTAGSGIIALNPTSSLWVFLAPAGAAVVAVAVLCVMLPDRVRGTEPLPRLSAREILSSLWFNPRTNPDFAWVWLSRLLVFVGITTLVAFQAYFLLARIGVAPDRIAAVMFGVLLLENGMSIVANLVAGWLSDRWNRRKVFVGYSAVLGGIGFVVAAQANGMPVFLAGVVLIGLAKGVYVAVDLALATDLLPSSSADAAKDMGLITAAALIANLVAPALAPLLLSLGSGGGDVPGAPAGNYLALFLGAAVFMGLGALAVRPIRTVR